MRNHLDYVILSQELVKIMLFAGSQEPTDVIILNNKKLEPYDDSHLQPHVGQTVQFCSAMLYFTGQSTQIFFSYSL